MAAMGHARHFSLLVIRGLEMCGCEGVYLVSGYRKISAAIFISSKGRVGASWTCGENISLQRSSSWIRLRATWALRPLSILSISLPTGSRGISVLRAY